MPLDFALARENMVENDVRTNDVTDRRLITAMRAIPREDFVPPAQREIAYGGLSVPLGGGRFLLEARCFSKLVQAAEIQPGDKVLDVGCGTGYSAAVLSRLAGQVIAVEEDPALAQAAQRNLAVHGGGASVTIERGALNAGSPTQGPFDVILFEGTIEEIPAEFVGQLRPEGRLLAVVASAGRLGRAMSFVRAGDGLSGRALFDASVPPLPGFAKKRAFVF